MEKQKFDKLYAQVAKIHNYFVNLADKNAHELWSNKEALSKYKDLLVCFNVLREAVSMKVFNDDELIPLFVFVCKATYDEDINGMNLSHVLFDDELMMNHRINALSAVEVISDELALDAADRLELTFGI